mmetsp:Transcript_11939/g.36399  ORF Transcript_11939/g.36399 Transcript_11939/m.36399 type:complete len:219 (+) Transcript_11939:1669-2325(+)
MKLKELESTLGCVRPFSSPNVELEQYPTSAHIASRMLFTAADSFDDIVDKSVGDFGCGGGILAAGASIMGASYVLGLDIDPHVLDVAAGNLDALEVDVELACLDVASLGTEQSSVRAFLVGKPFDTVVMNPPFGTRRKGIDTAFVNSALELCSGAVYSLHKTSTREHLRRKAAGWNVNARVVAELRYDIPKMYRFHTQKSKDVAVDLWRFAHVQHRRR